LGRRRAKGRIVKSAREDNEIVEDEQGGDVGRVNGRREAKIGGKDREDGRQKTEESEGWRHEG
jgi:hypothetical protein